MSCLIVDITLHISPLCVALSHQDLIVADVVNPLAPIIAGITRRDGMPTVELRDMTSRLAVDFGIVCTVGGDYLLRFEQAVLTWKEDENREGVVKYNTLIASGDWSLEEIEIEELL